MAVEPSPDITPIDPTVHLVCGFDENYAMPAGVMLRSVSRTLAPDRRGVAHLVGLQLGDGTKRKLAECCGDNLEVRFVDLDPSLLAGLPDVQAVAGHLNQTIFMELLTDRLVGDDVTRWVHLDADMVVTRSLHEVAEIDLEGMVLGAVRDFYVPTVAMPEGVARWRELGIDSRTPYLNSGLVVVDRAAWRRERVEERAFAYLRENHGSVSFAEQEAMSVVLVGRWKELHPTWNFLVLLDDLAKHGMISIYSCVDGREIDTARAGPAVIHYASSRKPWLEGTDDVPFHDTWWDVLAETPWASYRPPPTPKPALAPEILRRMRRAARVLVRGK
jgi:lipopolysaccharide biosynthesis glycosyltransferase